MTEYERPFARRLIEYVEKLGERGYSRRVRPADPALVAEIEGHIESPLPPEYRDFLETMGGDMAGFELHCDDLGGFANVLDCYRMDREKGERYYPRRGSVLLAEGDTTQCIALDGREPGRRPVRRWWGEFFDVEADSLERHCFKKAWGRYRFDRLRLGASIQIPGNPADAARVRDEARSAGLELLWFSDGASACLDSDTMGAYIAAAGERLLVWIGATTRESAFDLRDRMNAALGRGRL